MSALEQSYFVKYPVKLSTEHRLMCVHVLKLAEKLNIVSREVLIFAKLLSQITKQLIFKICIKKSALIPLIYIC